MAAMLAEADLQPESQLQHRQTIRLSDFLKAIASSSLDKVQHILHPELVLFVNRENIMRVTIKEYFFDNDEEAPVDGILLFDGDFVQISFDVENVPYTYKGKRVRGDQWLLKCASNGGTATLNKSVLNETGYEGTLIFQHLSNPRYQSMWEIERADPETLTT